MSRFNQKVIGDKIGLLNLATELGNVSKACQVMGLSRDPFHRYQTAVAEGCVAALFDAKRRKPNPKNRVGRSHGNGSSFLRHRATRSRPGQNQQ